MRTSLYLAVMEYLEYLGFHLNSNLRGESMAMRIFFKKVNAKVKFVYRQNNLSPRLKRLLCNFLVQAYLDYGCTSWFPLFNKNRKHKLQAVKNKCIRLCLDLSPHCRIRTNQHELDTLRLLFLNIGPGLYNR